jgi:hypothetical protein
MVELEQGQIYYCSVTKEDAGQERFEMISGMQGEYVQSRQLDAWLRATYHAGGTSTHYYNLFSLHAERQLGTIGLVITAKKKIKGGIIPS